MSSSKELPGIPASHQIITDQCRANGGPDAAFDRAVANLREAYEGVIKYREEHGTNENIDYHLILSVEQQ